eukprot:GEMP01008665.1.p1 GENE.GEMP01008665.1~~GEMP01008665.1.p1  ORF type:complete len:433 (+),score=53.17 GEMP01008665.1:1390-2688(+)
MAATPRTQGRSSRSVTCQREPILLLDLMAITLIATTVPIPDSIPGHSIGRPSSQQVEEGMGKHVALGHIWKLQLNNAAQAYARGAPNLPELNPVSTFKEAAGLIEELIPFFAWLLAVADPSSDRDEMIRMARKFEEWQALKSFPRVLIIEGLNQNAFVIAQIGLLFAVESLLDDGTYCVENGFLQPKELMSLRSYRVYLCDELKPHMWNLLSRFVEYEDLINVGIKKAWHYANELYQDAHKPPSMKKIFERGDPFRLAMGNPKQTGVERLIDSLKPAGIAPAHPQMHGFPVPIAGIPYPVALPQYINAATGEEKQSHVAAKRPDSSTPSYAPSYTQSHAPSYPQSTAPSTTRSSARTKSRSSAPTQSMFSAPSKSRSSAPTKSRSFAPTKSRSSAPTKSMSPRRISVSSKTFRYPNRISTSVFSRTRSSGAS